MDPILQLPPDLPPHEVAPLPPVAHAVVAQWPVGTFVEKLAVLDDGDIAVSACAFGRTQADRNALYVTTTGGIVTPPMGCYNPPSWSGSMSGARAPADPAGRGRFRRRDDRRAVSSLY